MSNVLARRLRRREGIELQESGYARNGQMVVEPVLLQLVFDHGRRVHAKTQQPEGMASAEVREIVQAARERQRRRYDGGYMCNAHIDTRNIRQHCKLDNGGAELLQTAIDRLGFSARAYDKVLRVARTLADLEDADGIGQQHVAEAIQYRSLDREGL